MCGCNVQIGSAASLQPGIIGIPLNGVLNDDMAPVLTWAWCINQDKVKAQFKKDTGLDISEEDFSQLVTGHKNGNDVKNYGISFLQVIANTPFTFQERENASCKLKLTT